MDKKQVDCAISGFFGLVGHKNSEEYTFFGGSAWVEKGYPHTSDIDILATNTGFELAMQKTQDNNNFVTYRTLKGKSDSIERMRFELSGVNFDIFHVNYVEGFLSSGFDKKEKFDLNNFSIYLRPIDCLKEDVMKVLLHLDGLDDSERICAKRATLHSRLYFYEKFWS